MSSWTATLRFLIFVCFLEESGSTRWPAGSYGLPRAKSGCPHADGFKWLIGRRYQDTENTASSNERSSELHFDAQVNRNGISRAFCMKKSKSWSDDRRSSWPSGKYCVYKKGETCPLKLLPGEIKWDDENKNNQNKKKGTLPEGVYDADTVIKYCCSTSGDVNIPISLPTLKPFFLLAYGSPQCQQVKWAVTSNEWIRYDTEDRGNSDGEWGAYPYGAGIKDHNITYCYYQDCRNKLTKERGTFRSPNYPRNYPNGQLCSWNILVNSTQRIRLIFTYFDLQEDRGTDSVTVYDGVNETGKMLGVFFGGNPPSEEGIVSSSNTLFVMFQSDKSDSFTGFSASYIALRIEECGTSLTSERGIFHSPNFPRRYPNGQLCSWNIIVNSTQRIHLIFTHFELQEDRDADSVTVYDGINESGRMLRMFHGGKRPSDEDIVSSSNTLSVIFQTDESGSGTGFRASYSAVRIVAGKSSSVVETFSWPQTSLLLRPEPTSSSLSVVKTADLGISSTEYRETTSTATVYHSPSNWLVTTPSSTAESDTVKPMLAPSTTTGKDKTSLHPSNTMLIKKSTSNEIRLESTDYKLSGQITSSYKTKSQQTTAVPEILPPGEECKTSLTLERGILHSPNFPRRYPNGQLCSWNIIVNSTHRIHLIFTHFDLQGDKDTDTVTVYDGINETGKMLGMFHGGKPPSEEGLVSSSNTLFVIFQTDESGSGTGFRAKYSAVPILAGKSSSIVETSSWPQTSILLRPEPTSSSLSVVKTNDLGISSTKYRETTSPATVYHSPLNWPVKTAFSIAQSDIVKPMLAPPNTTDKDKTSLYPLNTMPIKKSTSTDVILESTDYKLSGQITSSYKTESQQTAIPEIISPGIKDTSSALRLSSDLVHSMVSELPSQLTTAAENKSTTPSGVQVTEMISYSKATKSLKLSLSHGQERKTQASFGLHPSNTMLIKKSTSTDMRLESTDYKLSWRITSSYKTESQQTTAIPEILPPGMRDTSPVLPLNAELVHSPLSVLSLRLTTAAKSKSTSFDPRVPVTEMISYSKMTKSLKLSSSLGQERLTQAASSTPSSHMTETVFINVNATPAFARSKSKGFEKFQSPGVTGMKTKLPASTATYNSSVSTSTKGNLLTKTTLNIFTSRSQVSQMSQHFSGTYLHELSDLEMTLLPQNKMSFSKEEWPSTATTMVKLESSAPFSTVSLSLATEEVTSPIVRVLSITQTSLTATRTSKSQPVVTATVSSSSLISRHFTSRNQDIKHPASEMNPINSSLPATRLAFSTEGKVWTSTLQLSTFRDKGVESLSKSMKLRESVTLSYTKAETTPFYKKMTSSTETPMLEVTVASKPTISTPQAQEIVSLPKSMEANAGMTSWYTNTKMTFFTEMTSKLTDMSMLKSTSESRPAFSTTLALGMKARSASRISNPDQATSHTKGEITSFDFEMTSSVAEKSMETSLTERAISATPSMKVSKTSQVTEQHLISDKSLSVSQNERTSASEIHTSSFDSKKTLTLKVSTKFLVSSPVLQTRQFQRKETERSPSFSPTISLESLSSTLSTERTSVVGMKLTLSSNPIGVTSSLAQRIKESVSSTLSSLSTLSSSMSSLSSSSSLPSTSLLSSSSSSTSSPPSLSSSLSSILSSYLSLSSSPSWSSLFSPSSSSLPSNSSLLSPRLSTVVAKQSKSASTPPTSTSIQRISQMPSSSSSSSLMSSRSVLTQTFSGQRSEATKQSKAASTLEVSSSVQQSREFKSSTSLSSSSSALSSFSSSSSSSSSHSTIHPSSSSSKSPSFTSSSSSPSSSPTSSLASSSPSSSSSSSSSPTSSLASSSASSSSPTSSLHPSSSPISSSTSSVTSSFSLTSSSSSTLSTSSLSLPSSTSTSLLSLLSSSALSSSSASFLSLQLTPSVLSSSLLSSSPSSFSTFSWLPLSSSKSLRSSPSFSSPSPFVSSFSLPLSTSWRSLPRSSLLSVEQGTMSSHKGTKKTTHLTKSTHLSMTPPKYSSNGEQAVRKTSTVETSSSRTEQPTSSDPEITSPLTDKAATSTSPTRNVVAQKAERGGGGLNIILIVVPVVVSFLLIILIVAVITFYQRRKAKYEMEGKT